MINHRIITRKILLETKKIAFKQKRFQIKVEKEWRQKKIGDICKIVYSVLMLKANIGRKEIIKLLFWSLKLAFHQQNFLPIIYSRKKKFFCRIKTELFSIDYIVNLSLSLSLCLLPIDELLRVHPIFFFVAFYMAWILCHRTKRNMNTNP